MNFIKKLKFLFLDLISFDSPQAKLFDLSFIFLLLVILPTGTLNFFPMICIFHDFLLPLIFNGNCPTSGLFAGCNSPACGLTHAMSRLLHGDLIGAWGFNKLIFIVFIVMIVIYTISLIKTIKFYKKHRKIYSFDEF